MSDFVKRAGIDWIEDLSALRIIETFKKSKVQEENGNFYLEKAKKQLGFTLYTV